MADDPEALRQDARRRLQAWASAPSAAPPPELDADDPERLLAELRVYHAELEMQNEELRRGQAEMERTRDHFAALFDVTAVGHLILDEVGLIQQANQTFLKMLERPLRLHHDSLFDCVHPEDVHALRSRYRSFFREPVGATIELRLGTADPALWVELHGRRGRYSVSEDGPAQLLLTVVDISARRDAQLALATPPG